MELVLGASVGYTLTALGDSVLGAMVILGRAVGVRVLGRAEGIAEGGMVGVAVVGENEGMEVVGDTDGGAEIRNTLKSR